MGQPGLGPVDLLPYIEPGARGSEGTPHLQDAGSLVLVWVDSLAGLLAMRLARVPARPPAWPQEAFQCMPNLYIRTWIHAGLNQTGMSWWFGFVLVTFFGSCVPSGGI